MVKTLKELPIGQQTFENIIKQRKLYVDKTGEIYKLLKPGVRYFFSRPRRFGKSVTCSTLEAIFLGKRELFKGLAIDTLPYAWEKHAVVKFDFSEIDYTTSQDLTTSLHENIDEYAIKCDIALTKKLLKGKFAELIKKLRVARGPIAVIVDEYDKPLLDVLSHRELAKNIQNVLRDFYSVFKSGDVDAAVDFLFITGVTKFAKTSIFSGINYLQELSLREDCAALVGYTDEEVERYFEGHIQALADKEKQTYKATREKIKTWYNGYQFSEDQEVKVYNPFSLHSCLTEKRFSNYWFKSGTPTFIVDFINHYPEMAAVLPGLELEQLSSSSFDAFPLDFYYKQYKSLFVQAGYLSIRLFDPGAQMYTLEYPNEEVRKSMTNQIMEHVLNVTAEQFGDHVKRFRAALAAYDLDKFCSLLNDFYKLIPYVVHAEKFYQNVFFIICKFMGFAVTVEEPTDRGRIDAVVRLPAKTVIIEFKKSPPRTRSGDATAVAALKQIEDREYYKKFNIDDTKPLILVGIAGKCTKKGIALTWKVKVR